MNCKNCDRPHDTPDALCDNCLNNWSVMSAIIQTRQAAQHGPTTRQNLDIISREVKRLDTLWRRDRRLFKKETNTWY